MPDTDEMHRADAIYSVVAAGHNGQQGMSTGYCWHSAVADARSDCAFPHVVVQVACLICRFFRCHYALKQLD